MLRRLSMFFRVLGVTILFVFQGLGGSLQAGAAARALSREYAKMARAGGEPEVLGSTELNQALDQVEGVDFLRAYGRRATVAGAEGQLATSLQALRSGAQSNTVAGHCYNSQHLGHLFLNRIKSQYVIRNQSLYDPNHKVGFCFGRALIAHTQSLLENPEVPVLKVWSIGSMNRNGLVWRFHVSTLVLGCDRNWYALDTLFRNPLSVQTWISTMKSSYNASADTYFYISRADRLSPEGPEYSGTDFDDISTRRYFKDYLEQNPELKSLY